MRSAAGINWHIKALRDCARHTLQHGTLSRSSVDSALTTFDVELINDATLASFLAAIKSPYPLYDRQRDVLLDTPMMLINSQ